MLENYLVKAVEKFGSISNALDVVLLGVEFHFPLSGPGLELIQIIFLGLCGLGSINFIFFIFL